ncbi:MAG: hypothetical protein FJX52_00885 [Alphaproteobacteria bacterium]|nr:hypothetical protein [Alphaproteobacteria bacterium]
MRSWLAVLAAWLALAACSQSDTNFSQHSGFARFFVENPRSAVLPSEAERALLHKHRPRFMLPQGHAGLIDFYADYIAQGTLFDGSGRQVSDRVTRDLLNQHKADPRAVFVHRSEPGRTSAGAKVLARIDRANVVFPTASGPVSHRLTFLSYNAVFRHSGLPDWFAPWQMWVARQLGSLEDWHQLDHYTAATLVLDDDLAPIALILQQHNHRRSFILGEWVTLPADGRPVLDIAVRSNELYPFSPGGRPYRVVPHLGLENIEWYLVGGNRPRWAGLDATEGWDDEAPYTLDFLSADDAFYAFQGFLGERRHLPGRDGPPGADFNLWPSAKPWSIQLLGHYWHDGDMDDLAKLRTAFQRAGTDRGEAFRHLAEIQAPAFYRMWRCIKADRTDCGVRAP